MAKASDNPFPSILLVEQASAPATPASGQARLYRKTDNKLYVVDDAGTETEVGAGGGGGSLTLSTYTPTITATSNPTLGSGAVQFGRYIDDGIYIAGDLYISAGTSGFAAGSGLYKFLLPVAAHADDISYNLRCGVGHYYDASSGVTYEFPCAVLDSTHLLAYIDQATTSHTATTPVTPANNDQWRFQFRYRKA